MRNRRFVLGLAALASAGLLASASLADEPEEGRRYALIVGVQNYEGTALGSLRYSNNDAAGLADTLDKLGYHVTLMTRPEWKNRERDDLQPTADNIRDNLKAVLRNRKPADTVLLAFAGHGEQLKKDGKMYFCPEKCDLDKPETLVGLDEVYALLKDNAAGAKMLIVDACRNDPLAGRTAGTEKLESVTRPTLPEPPGGTVALFSCSKGEVAYESDALKHGFLFHFVIEGLEGKAANKKDGRITWLGLAKHVDDELPDAVTQELGAKAVQTPEVRGRAGRLVLGRIDSGTAKPDPITKEEDLKTEEFEYTVDGTTKKGARQVLTLDLGGDVTMEMVRIPRGTFMMGAPDSDKDADKDEKPHHEVTITRDFYLGKTLVTRNQFARFVAAKGYVTEAEKDHKGGIGFDSKSRAFKQAPTFTWSDPGFSQGDNHPVVEVSWNDAKAFCEWVGATTKRDVRLPTEAEWEYACRGGTTTRYFTGDAPASLYKSANICDQTAKLSFPRWPSPPKDPDNAPQTAAEFADGYVFTSPVDAFRPNPFGLHDMVGNVYEWCSDYFDEDYYGSSPKNDPENLKKSEKRSVRGGCFAFGPEVCRAIDRGSVAPEARAMDIGFRVELRPEANHAP